MKQSSVILVEGAAMLAVRTGAPRIALIIDRFDGRRGGAALWTRGFAAWLTARGCDVHVLARTIGPAEGCVPLTFHALEAERSPQAFASAVASRLRDLRPLISHDMGSAVGCDVFQPHFGSGLACWNGSVASYPAWLRPVKRLCGQSRRYRRLRKFSAAQYGSDSGTGIFVAVSHKVARDMESLHQVPAERIRVVHNGVDLSRFAANGYEDARTSIRRHYGIGDGEVLLIAVAHHLRLKGIPRLIRVVKQLRREGEAVKLLLCGQRARGASAPLDCPAVVRCGRVDDVAPLYAAADVCVHPTFYDACSLVTLESMAAGLPLVTTYANGASELISDGVDGVLVNSHDDAVLASALRPLVRSTVLRHALGEAGRRLVRAHSVEENYRQIIASYIEALAQRAASADDVERLLSCVDHPGEELPSAGTHPAGRSASALRSRAACVAHNVAGGADSPRRVAASK